MKHSFKSSLMFVLVVLALIVSAVGVTPAFADDVTPPPAATETPVATEEPVATEPPVVTEEPPATEEPFATEVPVVTEEPIATEVPILTEEPAVTEEPVATEVPVTDSSEEAPSVVDALEQLSAVTQIVVLDEAGSPEPLATQEAAEIVQTGDPMWCPAGVTPGAPECTASFTSLQALLDYLAIDANEPTQAGVIWIAADYNSSVNDAGVSGLVLDGGTAFATMSQYDLTIQGGWSGGNNTVVDHVDPSAFVGGIYLSIQNWTGNVTINDINASGSLSYGTAGLTVSTSGDVTVTNSVFYLDKVGLDITSTNGSVTLDGVISQQYTEMGANITASDDVNIINSNFGDAFAFDVCCEGLNATSTNGSITLNNVFIEDVRLGAHLEADGDINIMDSTFSSTGWLGGFSASSTNGNIFITDSLIIDNQGNGAYLMTPGDVIVRNSEFIGNGHPFWPGDPVGYGLNAADVRGCLALYNVTFEGNRADYLYDGVVVLDPADCPSAPASDSLASAMASGNDPVLYYPIEQTQDQLPAVVGEGNLFASAFKIILTPAGEKIRNLQIELEFPIPEDMQDDQLAVLFWDGSMWVPVLGGRVIDGYFVITVTRPGYYVLVSQ